MFNLKNILSVFWVGLALFAAVARADTVQLRADHPDRYVVVKGDTLWDISARFLEDPWLWPKIWHINPAIENPNLIYPGDVIMLKYEHGQPVLVVERGRQTVRLSPHTRTKTIEGAIPTIPVNAIQQFLLHPRVVSRDELDHAGYVVAQQGGRLVSGAGDTIYARDLGDKGTQEYSIYHIGQAYRDPVSHDLLGYQAIQVATANLQAYGDPSTLFVASSNREILSGDRLLPFGGQQIQRHFLPHAPAGELSGQIIAVLDGVSRIGQYQTVVLNLGTGKGVEAGDVLAIYQQGDKVRDTVGELGGEVQLPDRRAGLLMVVKPFKEVSYALVMQAQRDIRLLDKVANP